jgi:hypothetical protein
MYLTNEHISNEEPLDAIPTLFLQNKGYCRHQWFLIYFLLRNKFSSLSYNDKIVKEFKRPGRAMSNSIISKAPIVIFNGLSKTRQNDISIEITAFEFKTNHQ